MRECPREEWIQSVPVYCSRVRRVISTLEVTSGFLCDKSLNHLARRQIEQSVHVLLLALSSQSSAEILVEYRTQLVGSGSLYPVTLSQWHSCMTFLLMTKLLTACLLCLILVRCRPQCSVSRPQSGGGPGALHLQHQR